MIPWDRTRVRTEVKRGKLSQGSSSKSATSPLGQTSEESGSGTGTGNGTAEEGEGGDEGDDEEEGDGDGEVEEEFDGSEEPSPGRGSESMSSLGQPISPSWELDASEVTLATFLVCYLCVWTWSLQWLSCTQS